MGGFKNNANTWCLVRKKGYHPIYHRHIVNIWEEEPLLKNKKFVELEKHLCRKGLQEFDFFLSVKHAVATEFV